MVNRKLYRPKEILRWCVAVFEREGSFGQRYLDNVVNGFMSAAGKLGRFRRRHRIISALTGVCAHLGMRVYERDPIVKYFNPQGDIIQVRILPKSLQILLGRCADAFSVSQNLGRNGSTKAYSA